MQQPRSNPSSLYVSSVAVAFAVLCEVACSSADLGSATNGGLNGGSNASTGGASNTGSSSSTSGGSGNGSTGGQSSNSTTGGGANASTGGGSAQNAPTWTQLWNSYFGSGTPGNCTSCHGSGTSPAFSNASQLCTVLKGVGVISNGSASMETLLTWFNTGGSMPPGGASNLSSAVNDINAWKNAGAVCP